MNKANKEYMAYILNYGIEKKKKTKNCNENKKNIVKFLTCKLTSCHCLDTLLAFLFIYFTNSHRYNLQDVARKICLEKKKKAQNN